MKIVRPGSEATYFDLNFNMDAWKVALEVRGKRVRSDVSITRRARSWWESTKSASGVASFGTLRKDDILSVISAAKREKVRLFKNRWGSVCGYSIIAKTWTKPALIPVSTRSKARLVRLLRATL